MRKNETNLIFAQNGISTSIHTFMPSMRMKIVRARHELEHKWWAFSMRAANAVIYQTN